ncbi:MAG: VCBS repeat-containing protein [Verrucomicrobiae bacterium]|nr:VCBS repeat-containing protein [Verrucomicrobiae bacterium]MCP5542089.1 VCBS repeat-containing protein [Akkermansiaceae bacterium]
MSRPTPLSRSLSAILAALALPVRGAGDETRFAVHEINPDSAFSACAVDDVNRDGRLDIVCGAWWYEAPRWTAHFIQPVQQIRGRYDGYSHLPYDVDGDGDTDFVNVNYRSQSIHVTEHPADPGRPWPKHTIALPGAMESGRLHDIDADGHLDILPNGVKFAAWWRFDPKFRRFERHDLPAEVASHGVGFGDIDGDGRGDVVGAKGWARAPEDRLAGAWDWFPEFDLGKSASVPILVVDPDEDGDNDLVLANGHDYGLFWMEQTREGEKRRWKRQSIDDSWSQCHAPLWCDLDGDGRPELVAGKRYLAHDGRDPGAHDPLVIYRYQFDPARKAWDKHPIAENGKVGFGLDPKAADLDADGDLDLVCPGRSGLFWLENLRLGPAAAKPKS